MNRIKPTTAVIFSRPERIYVLGYVPPIYTSLYVFARGNASRRTTLHKKIREHEPRRRVLNNRLINKENGKHPSKLFTTHFLSRETKYLFIYIHFEKRASQIAEDGRVDNIFLLVKWSKK